MINICSQCLKINPLSDNQCHYCQGICQPIKPLDFGQFCAQRQKKGEGKSQEKEIDWEKLYPDLRLFADCCAMSDPFDLILARP